MPANTLDHRTLGAENWQDIVAPIATGLLLANPSLDQAAPTNNVTLATGSAQTNTALVVVAGSNAFRGRITFTSGGTTAGQQAVVTFPFAITPQSASASMFLYVVQHTTTAGTPGIPVAISSAVTISSGNITGFTINSLALVSGSTYAFDWLLIA